MCWYSEGELGVGEGGGPVSVGFFFPLLFSLSCEHDYAPLLCFFIPRIFYISSFQGLLLINVLSAAHVGIAISLSWRKMFFCEARHLRRARRG